jgi:hypothetical protein
MELLIKLYSAQASRIGIKFIYEYQAVKAYETLIKNGGKHYRLHLELKKTKAQLTLISALNGLKWEQKDLDYKIEMVQKLTTYIKSGDPLNFVHVFPRASNIFVAKPFNQNQLIVIDDYQIISPGADLISEPEYQYF